MHIFPLSPHATTPLKNISNSLRKLRGKYREKSPQPCSRFTTRGILFIVALLSLHTGAKAVDGTGLTATYYDSYQLTGNAYTRIDPNIDFVWTNTTPGIDGIGKDNFSVVWRGQILANASESYTFHMTSDDGVMVWVAGQRLICNWTDHSATENSGSIQLTAGKKYPVVVLYYQRNGGSIAQLRWSSQSITKEIVPQKNLYPEPDNPTGLNILSDLDSRTSPAWLEGVVNEDANSMEVTVGNIQAKVTKESPTKWFASTSTNSQPLGVQLSPSHLTKVVVSAKTNRGNKRIKRNLLWTITNLADLPYGLTHMTLRPGDKLLLNVDGVGHLGEIDPNYNGTNFTPVYSGHPGKKYQVAFPNPGIYEVRGRLNGNEVGRLTVTVVSVDTTQPIACQMGFPRQAEVVLSPLPSAQSLLSFTGENSDWLSATQLSTTATGLRLDLMPMMRGNLELQARIGGIDGPVLGKMTVNSFTLTTSATQWIEVIETLPDGSQLAEATLTLSPMVPDLTITMTTFISGVTFDDSTTQKIISSNDFTNVDGDGQYVYHLLRAPGVNSKLCHRYIVDQNGVKVSR